MSGDVFAVLQRREPDPRHFRSPYSLRIHLIEADRVRTPTEYGGAPYPQPAIGKEPNTGRRIFDGVEVDADGMISAYYVHSTYPAQYFIEKNDWTRIEAYGERTGLPNILHVMSSERPGQYRGVSYLAPAIEPILQLNRYINSALTMALVQSFFTAWVILKSNEDEIPWNSTGSDENPQEPGPVRRWERSDPDELGMGPGDVRTLKENEDIKFGNPTMPVPGFGDFVGVFCKLIGAGFGVPHDVLVKEYNASYSASRAALLDAWEEFRMRRRWFVDDFCQPVYEVWLAEAVALGRIKAPGFFENPLLRAAWCGAKWIGPAPGSIDPLKEAEAAVLQIQHALKTHDQVTTELTGGDWEKNVAQLMDENKKLLEAGGGNVQITMNLNEENDNEGGNTK